MDPTNIQISAVRQTLISNVQQLTANVYENGLPLSAGYFIAWEYSNITSNSVSIKVSGTASQSISSIPVSVNLSPLNTPTEYRYVTTPPLCCFFFNIKNNSQIPNGVTGSNLTQEISSIRVVLSANYENVNRAPTNLSVSAIAIENRYFIRSLTAIIMQEYSNNNFIIAEGQSSVAWNFDSNKVWATKINGVPYAANTAAPVSAIGTMVFYTTASTYDFTTRSPKICAFDIEGIGLDTASSDTYELSCDEFPNIDVNAFINFENANFSPLFYRLTSTTPYNATIRGSTSYYNLNVNSSSPSHIVWYTLNNIPTLSSTFLPEQQSFICNVPTISSVQIYLSSTTPVELQFNPNLAWYSSHIFTKSISAIFLPYFLNADFIGWPGSYFKNAAELEYISLAQNNISASPGMFFYGEGHVDTITLSALTASNILSYLWTINNLSFVNHELTYLNALSSSLQLTLSSTTNMDLRLPVSLLVTNNDFPSNMPRYYYDDITGVLRTYPYYISTVNLDGTPSLFNNTFRETIWIKPYDTPVYTFKPGLTSFLILPSDGTNVRFRARYFSDKSAFACNDKYGITWKWANLCTYNSNNFTGTWEQTESTNTYPKKWRNEGSTDVTFNTNPVTCSATPITWTLSSSSNWPQPHTFITSATNLFDYYLRVQDFGTELFTVSYYTSTNITINAQQTVTCYISVVGGDWKPSDKIINLTFNSIVGTNPDAALYTPNRFILTGTKVNFENLITQKQFVSSIEIDFEDENLPLTGLNVATPFFTTEYSTPGKKTLNVKIKTTYQDEPIVASLTDIVNVVTEYDEVFPNEYRSITNPLQLPWPEQPTIGSNDWAINNNINSCFKKFYENIEYLESRSRAYSDTYSDYYGYLGSVPTSANNPNACLSWSWEDLDCLNTALNYQVTWQDVLSGDNELDIGTWIKCGQWANHIVRISGLTPNCLGLYDLEWSWRSRKNTAAIQTTWANTKLNQRYSKKWYYEPSFSSQGVVCSPGTWQVNLPFLNKYYATISNNTVQAKCIVYGIVSKNNNLYVAQKTQLKLLSSDYIANFYDYRDTVDSVISFSDIKNIHLDNDNKIYILDGLLSQIVVLTYERDTPGDNWKVFTIFGGYGGRSSNNKFNAPNDFCIDQINNIWVCDTGNKCIKHFSNTGTWIKTVFDSNLETFAPISLTVDSNLNVHVLTNNNILVYSYTGEYITSYEYKTHINGVPKKITNSYNREMIYVATDTEVVKFFRNGVFAGYILNNRPDVTNITCLYHDEFRNLLIGTNDKILKFADLMTIQKLKGSSPYKYWLLDEIYINDEEYVQNWVYIKSFQRLWDNIEIFRNSLYYKNTGNCKTYIPPIYTKDEMNIGQNELVTSTVINRLFGYLWSNFSSIAAYFDPSCSELKQLKIAAPVTTIPELTTTTTTITPAPTED